MLNSGSSTAALEASDQRHTMLNSRSSTAALEASENDDGVSLLSDHGVDVARYREAVAANERLLSSSHTHAAMTRSTEAHPESSRADVASVPGHPTTSSICSPRARSAEADRRADLALVPGHLAAGSIRSPRARTSAVSAAVLAAAAAAEAAVAEAAAAEGAARSFGSRAGLPPPSAGFSNSCRTRNSVLDTHARAEAVSRAVDESPWKAALADLHPVGARIEHIGLDMRRSAGELVAEVRELSDRLAMTAATPVHRQPDSWGEHFGDCQALTHGKMLGRPTQSSTFVAPGHKQLESSEELSESCLGQTHELGRTTQTVNSTDSPAHRSHAQQATASTSSLLLAPPDSAWQKDSEAAVLRECKAWEAERSLLLCQISQLKQALEEQECQVSQLRKSLEQRELQERQISDLKKTLYQREIQQQSEVSELKRELEQRDFELASRPTHRLTQLMRNKIAELERRASPEQCQFDKRRLADTRTLIRNDRRRHAATEQQRMHNVDAKDTDTLVSELCKSLHVTRLADAEAAVDGLRRVADKKTAKLNNFVHEVLTLVNSGKPHVSFQTTDALMIPEAEDEDKALSALRAWAVRSQTNAGQGASADQHLRARLGQALGCGYARADDAPTDEVLVARAQELCQAACKPRGILGHFMKLFDVQSVEGCLPAMNQIYSRLGELTTLHKVVRERFGMYSKSRTASVADTIRTIEQTGPRAQVTAAARPVHGNLTHSRSEFHDWSD
eukprot:TRINITY_DN2302_c0_g1_i1.p1 TRINITY_DN2302_c0_g1~~TRINITY_DN2302_c0_g1_i1.p1  ORF type:complete len:735 (-),score=131.23 TRINITY_DN2302_c0_g1_i1:85-2289(-)